MTINLAGNKTFTSKLKEQGISIKRNQISTLQVNIGKKCNQACHHCHVEAGPNRTENMTRATIEQLLLLIKNSPQVTTIDITGGAPELNQNFRFFVQSLRKLNKKVLDRCNLTVLFESGQEDTAEFLATNQVEIVASLPCYLEENVDTQRGNGVFQKSIQALKLLNNLGYGKKNSGLVLNLVYNPITATLPPAQGALEADYKKIP